MLDKQTLFQQIMSSPRITRTSFSKITRDQGAYILWMSGDEQYCLKVGIAGPRKGKGLKERIGNHFGSNTNNSVLAKHMAADSASDWAEEFIFKDREQRKKFLGEKCYFQVIALPGISNCELKQYEKFLIAKLKPCYAGRTKKKKSLIGTDRKE